MELCPKYSVLVHEAHVIKCKKFEITPVSYQIIMAIKVELSSKRDNRK
jgi:hypothetical protein